MFKSLLVFEWYYQRRKPLFYIIPMVFLALGTVMGASAGISFPNIHINSPYQVAYLAGILSLVGIFAATLIVAQSILRESESKFDAIIYGTPVPKLAYLGVRLLALGGMAVFVMLMAMLGLFTGQLISGLPPGKFGAFYFSTYALPFLLIMVPNMILCVALLCSAAWVSRSKLVIYITGLFIYILYITGAIFSNSPLIAGSKPMDAAMAGFFAKADPFGLAAFFEQTRYWTAGQRNTWQIVLEGNLLFNRVLWLVISAAAIGLSFARFSFRKTGEIRPAQKTKKNRTASNPAKPYHTVAYDPGGRNHFLQTMSSFFRLNVLTIVKGIPFLLIIILWTALLGIELSNAVSGDPRSGEAYATSALMFSTIQDVLPSFTLMVLLFYSAELLWKSREARFYSIEAATPYPAMAAMAGQLIALSCIPLFLVAYSGALGIVVQLIKGYLIIDWATYAGMFYYLALPLIINAALMLAIQLRVPNKYAGLAIATVFILLTCTSIGGMAGLRYPLFLMRKQMPVPLSDLSGFGAYTHSFNWQLIYCGTLALVLLLWSSGQIKGWRKKLNAYHFVAIVAGVLCLSSAAYIYYQTSVAATYQTEKERDDWRQAYETKFKIYENFPQPTIIDLKTKIDLYPSKGSYEVEGRYELKNNHQKTIDSLLIYIDPETKLLNIKVEDGRLVKDESAYGHYWYILNRAMAPGDTRTMSFSFSSGWTGFKPHTPFNSILGNGSFMRISRYYPSFGYNNENELTNEIKRTQRGMRPQDPLKKLEAPRAGPYDYQFINYEAQISTDAGQTAITSGDLVKRWTATGRPYFLYRSNRPMPFRFAVSSARYLVKKDSYKNIPIEIYYHPQHYQNVARLVANAKSTLAYCEKNFGPYPHNSVRFAEVSSFAVGFAATTYPNTIYMKEDGGFFNNLNTARKQDIINELAGHELSHEWWGSAGFAPEIKEGGWVLTETLAKYTELMLYRKASGGEAMLENIRMYLDLYLSDRSFSKETPLYKTTFDTPFIPYDKGAIIMYQLQRLIGEEQVNAALRSLYQKHRFPLPPPETTDVINELYAVSPADVHGKIDEMFKQIVTYDNKLESAVLTGGAGHYKVDFTASIHKYVEDGSGGRREIMPDATIELGLTDEKENIHLYKFTVSSAKLTSAIITDFKPVKLILDPNINDLDTFIRDNEIELK